MSAGRRASPAAFSAPPTSFGEQADDGAARRAQIGALLQARGRVGTRISTSTLRRIAMQQPLRTAAHHEPGGTSPVMLLNRIRRRCASSRSASRASPSGYSVAFFSSCLVDFSSPRACLRAPRTVQVFSPTEQHGGPEQIRHAPVKSRLSRAARRSRSPELQVFVTRTDPGSPRRADHRDAPDGHQKSLMCLGLSAVRAQWHCTSGCQLHRNPSFVTRSHSGLT